MPAPSNDYTFGSGTLPSSKTDLRALGVGEDVVNFLMSAEFDKILSALASLKSASVAGDFVGLANMISAIPTGAPSGGAKVYAAGGKVWALEDGSEARVLTAEDGVYDIRNFGAKPGSSGKAATTAAFEEIFDLTKWTHLPSPIDGKRNAIIHVPFTSEAWYCNALEGYVGSPGASLNIIGETPSGRSGIGGSVLLYDDTTGGRLLDLIAINASTIKNITFHGNRKARQVVTARQFWDTPGLVQVGSSGLSYVDCVFTDPENDYNSILVAAGQDDHPPDTLQTSEQYFTRCIFNGIDIGSATKQGWGFKALNAGNTKNFTFDTCQFNGLYRGIESYSGFLIIKNCNGANIGYDRGGAALYFASANSMLVIGGGMENGTVGYAARFVDAGQGTRLKLASVYMAGNTPGDDYMVRFGGPTKVISCDIGNNSRSSASTLPWVPSTLALVGQQRKNSGKLYECITQGITAASGGPTTTASDITDGAAHWRWVTSELAGNHCKLQGAQQEVAGWGGVSVEQCTFPYNTTPLTGVPLHDGNGNKIWGALGKADTDYAKGTPHKVSGKGNNSGLWGSDQDEQLPDFDGSDQIVLRDQWWTDNIDGTTSVIKRNANGCYVIEVPASLIAFQGTGHVTICAMPPLAARFKIIEALLEVVTPLSGAGVTGITASIGLDPGDDDDLLLAQDAETVATYGIDPAEQGAAFVGGRYFQPSGQPNIILKILTGGGAVSGITAGLLRIILEGKRLGP